MEPVLCRLLHSQRENITTTIISDHLTMFVAQAQYPLNKDGAGPWASNRTRGRAARAGSSTKAKGAIRTASEWAGTSTIAVVRIRMQLTIGRKRSSTPALLNKHLQVAASGHPSTPKATSKREIHPLSETNRPRDPPDTWPSSTTYRPPSSRMTMKRKSRLRRSQLPKGTSGPKPSWAIGIEASSPEGALSTTFNYSACEMTPNPALTYIFIRIGMVNHKIIYNFYTYLYFK